MIESKAYHFGQRRTRELLECHGLEPDQVDAIAHDMALEWDRVLDGVVDAMVGALMEKRYSRREARRMVRGLLEGER